MKTVAVISGGLDSTVMLHHLVKRGDQVTAIAFHYGQKHTCEIMSAIYQVTILGLKMTLVDLQDVGARFVSALTQGPEIPDIQSVLGDPQPPTYVPNRNMIFLSIAVGFAESVKAQKVAYGAQRHDIYGYWDTTPEFVSAMQAVLSLNRKDKIELEAPLVTMGKSDVVKMGVELGVDFKNTWSCYRGGKLACGTCPTCAERLQAFHANGLVDPLPYVTR